MRRFARRGVSRWGLLGIVLCTSVFAGLGEARTSPDAALPPAPYEGDCLGFQGPCFYKARETTFVFSRHVLHIGDHVTASGKTIFAGAILSTDAPGLKLLGCTGHKPAEAPISCKYRAVSLTYGWQYATAGISVSLGGNSYLDSDFYAVVGHHPVIEGFVRDATGTGVPAASLNFKGAHAGEHAITDTKGYYEAQVPAGTYDVSSGKGGQSGLPAHRKLTAREDATVTADFIVDRAPGISGTVRAPCEEKGCHGRPVADVTVRATAGKDAATSSALTDKDGRYAIRNLAADSYRVEPSVPPGSSVAPEFHIAQVRESTVDGVDFDVCLAAQTGGPEAGNACGPKFDYRMDPRFDKTGEPTGKTPQDYEPASFPVHFTIKNGKCDKGATYEFAVNGVGVPAQLIDACRYDLDFAKEATYSVRVDQHDVGEADPAKVTTYTKDVVVQDFLIVTVGDSLSSGEGNKPFTDGTSVSLCHRSKTAFGRQAARKIEAEDRRSAVTFLHAACTGATTSSLAKELGTAGQIARVQSLIGTRRIDALEVSVGINDIDFGGVTQFCTTTRDCWKRLYTSAPGAVLMGKGQLDDYVSSLVDRLPTVYSRLASQLSAAFPASQLDSKDVYLTQYPNPLRDENGKICASVIGSKTVGFTEQDGHEVSLAERRFFDPLNRAIDAAASSHGWQEVTMPSGTFERHGVCSSAAWFHTLGGSVAELNPGGALHPNATGHEAMSKRLLSRYDDSLLPGGKARKP